MNTLAILRKKAGLSQMEVAAALGVTQGSVSQWENDLSTPRMSKLLPIAKLYKCSIDEICLGEGRDKEGGDSK